MLQRMKYFLCKAKEGVAAVEFALATPLLLVMMLGTAEVSFYILTTQKVEKAAFTMADVVAQSQTITGAQLDALMYAAEQVMKPHTMTTNGRVIVTAVGTNAQGNPVVLWQRAGGGNLSRSSMIGSPGLTATLPAGFTLAAGYTLITTEVYYRYTPNVNTWFVSASDIYRVSYYKPRLGALNTLG